jgi:hypothetical protein
VHHGLAGSIAGVRARERTGHVSRTTAASFVDPSDGLAVVSAATDVGSRAGRASNSGVVARGRANVSSPATSSGNDLWLESMHQW